MTFNGERVGERPNIKNNVGVHLPPKFAARTSAAFAEFAARTGERPRASAGRAADARHVRVFLA